MEKSRFKTWLSIIGTGLVILGIIALSAPVVEAWMAWLTLFAGALTLLGAASTQADTPPRVRSGGAIALALGALALWLGGMVEGVEEWLTWWTFGFAVALLIVGISARRPRETRVPPLRKAA